MYTTSLARIQQHSLSVCEEYEAGAVCRASVPGPGHGGGLLPQGGHGPEEHWPVQGELYVKLEPHSNLSQHKVRGGNANNSCTVLSRLGFKTSFYGSLATGLEADWVVEGMQEDGVIVEDCPRYSGYPCPNSVVITNSSTGSRTIIHTNLG